jgi:hypothetical protein
VSKPDKQRFSEAMDDLGVIYDKDITVAMKRLYWEDLENYPIAAIEAACQAHRRDRDRGRFFPKPADLLARIGGDAAHIPAEAAWAIALESLDENRTVIWTDEIQRAREAARPIWEIGDKYGARMAFVKAYESILLATSHSPRYKVSVGNYPAQRQEAIAQAMNDGLITSDQAKHYLPAPAITPQGQAIVGLLTGNVVSLPQSDQTLRRLDALRASLHCKTVISGEAEERRATIEERRRAALDALAELQQRQAQ